MLEQSICDISAQVNNFVTESLRGLIMARRVFVLSFFFP